MILESAQILSDAVRTYNYDGTDVYKGAYHNHPSTVWARKSRQHFLWLCEHALELCQMYTDGSCRDGKPKTWKPGKIHSSQAVIERCLELAHLIPDNGFSISGDDLAIKNNPVGLAAFDKFVSSEQSFQDAVDAYIVYYFNKDYVKQALAA